MGFSQTGARSYTTFASAYAAAQSGDHIILDDGVYPGTINLDRNFAIDNPVVIRSRRMVNAMTPGSIFSGAIAVKGTGHWLYQVKLTLSEHRLDRYQISINSSYFTLTNSWLADDGSHSASSIFIPADGAVHHIWIGWNRMTARDLEHVGSEGIFLKLPNGLLTATNAAHHLYIYRNFFQDKVESYESPESHTIYFGDSHITQWDKDQGALTETYIEENYLPASSRKTRAIYLKRACNLMRNNVLAKGNFGFRHGMGGKIWGNRLGSATRFIVNDGMQRLFNDIRGNVFKSSLLLSPGIIRTPGHTPGIHGATDYALLVGNVGPVVVGYLADNYVVSNDYNGVIDHLRVYAHKGAIDTTSFRENIDMKTLTINSGNPLNYEIPETIPETFGDTDVGFAVPQQGL